MSELIKMEQISKTYRMGESEIHALLDINLTIHTGEITAIGGPSGSGKSTLLNICGLIDQSDNGSYWLGEHEVSSMSPNELTRLRRERIGFIFQSFNLIPVMSAWENVEYPLLLSGIDRADRRQLVDKMIEAVGLSQYAHHIPDRLSGGQRQRVAVARALVKKPDLVIADEPTANLDTGTANQIIQLMQKLGDSQGTTFLIATHDERMVQQCHRVLHLTDGALS